MRRSALLAALVVTAAALVLQLVLLPLVSRDLNSANAFLALLVVVSLRQRRLAGVLWGAALGGLSDLLLMQHVGYHGATFTVLGYALGWLGGKMVISGFAALFALTAAAVVLDAAAVTLLFTLLERAPSWDTLWLPVGISALVTPLAAVGLERLYRQLLPGERP